MFGGSRLAAGMMGASAEAGNSRLSGMYSTESLLARAGVPMCGKAVCKGRLGLLRETQCHQTPLALICRWGPIEGFLAPE